MVWAEILHLTRTSVLIQSKRGTAALQQSGLGFGPDSLVIQKEAEDASATVSSIQFHSIQLCSITFHYVMFHSVQFLFHSVLHSSHLVSFRLVFLMFLDWSQL